MSQRLRISISRRVKLRSIGAPKAASRLLKTKLPCLLTMLEGTNDMRRGTIEDALRGARSEIVTWNAAEAGIPDLTLCGLTRFADDREKSLRPVPRAMKKRTKSK